MSVRSSQLPKLCSPSFASCNLFGFHLIHWDLGGTPDILTPVLCQSLQLIPFVHRLTLVCKCHPNSEWCLFVWNIDEIVLW